MCDRNSDRQTLRSILVKLCTQVIWCKFSIEFVNEKNRLNCFKMTSHQTIASKNYKICLVIFVDLHRTNIYFTNMFEQGESDPDTMCMMSRIGERSHS